MSEYPQSNEFSESDNEVQRNLKILDIIINGFLGTEIHCEQVNLIDILYIYRKNKILYEGKYNAKIYALIAGNTGWDILDAEKLLLDLNVLSLNYKDDKDEENRDYENAKDKYEALKYRINQNYFNNN